MIKDQMNFPLAVDNVNVKATTAVLYTATDEEFEAYAIGYIPWEMVQESVIFKGMQIGTMSNIGDFFSYEVESSFRPDRGLPFSYIYSQNPSEAHLNAYYNGTTYANTSWGTTSQAGLLHSYNTDYFVTSSPQLIATTFGLRLTFHFWVVYLPDGSEGGASSPSGENGWATVLANKNVTADILTLDFSITSNTDGQYMPTGVTFTKDDLENADANGVMKKANGTTTYAGITYNITVHCAIIVAEIYDNTAAQLKNGVVQSNNLRLSSTGNFNEPLQYTLSSQVQSRTGVFTANAFDSIEIEVGRYLYIKLSDTSYEYVRFSGVYYGNDLLSGGCTITDLKIFRSIARPVYKINNAFYVAEFNDDYTITGDLIPYAQARAWQKNINPDDNKFDPKDIPEPEPPEDLPDAYGADSIPDLNFSLGAISNFITMYCLTESQVADFGAYLWANIFSTDFVRSIGTILVNDFSINPADILNYFISLRRYPFDLYGKNGYNSIANGSLYFGRGVAGIPITGAFGKMESLSNTFGGEYIEVPALYNDFRDYEPYTRITVFVPFCGSLEVTPSEVVGKKIFITYTVDYSTGNVQADVWVNSGVAFILGTLTGQIGATVQMTASNNMEVLQKVGATAMNFVKTASSVAAIAATGGAAAESFAAGEITSAEYTAKELSATASMANTAAGTLSSAPVVGSNPIHSSATGSGFASFATPRARLIVERRKYTIPKNYNHVYGQAENKTVKLSELVDKGFTVCKNVDLSGIPATQDELTAIESLLTSGVYF